jgi:hypothetical protein
MRSRTVFPFLILLSLSFSLHAVSFSLSADAAALCTLALPEKSLKAELSLFPAEEMRLSLDGSFHSAKEDTYDLRVLEGGIAVDCFPFENLGFYTGMSLMRLCYLSGYDSPENPVLSLFDVRAGWMFCIHGFLIDLRFTILEPGTEGSESSVSGFYEFCKYTFGLYLGWMR